VDSADIPRLDPPPRLAGAHPADILTTPSGSG
jgi:hypothetical protein